MDSCTVVFGGPMCLLVTEIVKKKINVQIWSLYLSEFNEFEMKLRPVILVVFMSHEYFHGCLSSLIWKRVIIGSTLPLHVV
jgi:hypothetical protein